MKTHSTYYSVVTAVLLSLLLALGSCDDDDPDDDPVDPTPDLVTLKDATLSGSQEVPANNSQATGTFKGTYNRDTKRLSYSITFGGVEPTGMHFHKGAVGVAGPIEVAINPGSDPYSGDNPFRSPMSGNTQALSAAQEADLLAGNWYINIHSSQYPDGEIRAQIAP